MVASVMNCREDATGAMLSRSYRVQYLANEEQAIYSNLFAKETYTVSGAQGRVTKDSKTVTSELVGNTVIGLLLSVVSNVLRNTRSKVVNRIFKGVQDDYDRNQYQWRAGGRRSHRRD